MQILANLPNETIAGVGIAAQSICAIGVFVVGRWRSLLLFIALIPVYWAAPFILASGHCLECLDGVLYLPVAFLAVACFLKVRSIDRSHDQ